ncbi:MAG: hypothetical protein LH480_03040 [Rubrivivax sp.]|nr:hypothetical protein [Rubrivivax sp.]
MALQLRTQGNNTTLPFGADGVIAFPNSPQLRKDNPAIWVDSPPDVKVGLGIDMLIQLPAGPTLRYGDAMELIDRAGEGLRKHAGVWALFMPKPQGLELRFDPATAVTVVMQLPAGEQSLTTDVSGILIVPLTSELRTANPLLRLPRPPLEARPFYKAHMQLAPDGEWASR